MPDKTFCRYCSTEIIEWSIPSHSGAKKWVHKYTSLYMCDLEDAINMALEATPKERIVSNEELLEIFS